MHVWLIVLLGCGSDEAPPPPVEAPIAEVPTVKKRQMEIPKAEDLPQVKGNADAKMPPTSAGGPVVSVPIMNDNPRATTLSTMGVGDRASATTTASDGRSGTSFGTTSGPKTEREEKEERLRAIIPEDERARLATADE